MAIIWENPHRGTLIEAKSSASREHIRMGVGQLLDYSFQGREKLGEVKMALLLPTKPTLELEQWLSHLSISVIWQSGLSFLDNANGTST